MEYSKLSSYKLKKGVFVSPWNDFMTSVEDTKSWVYGRLPEYIWIGLIFYKYGRQEGLKRLSPILKAIKGISKLNHIRLSDLLSLSSEQKGAIFSIICASVGAETLEPLTVVISADIDATFASNFTSTASIEKRIGVLSKCMRTITNHQSDEATDIRYVVLYYSCLIGKMHLLPDQYNRLYKYQFLNHTDEEMHMISPLIRSTEMMILTMEEPNVDYLNLFWSRVSELTECELYMISHDKEDRNTKEYVSVVEELFVYLQELHATCNPLDKRAKVIIGLATYSFKRLKEAEDHNLYNTISGRSIVRSIIENYIILKYMLEKESENTNIWDDYEQYGIGQYKLILARYRESTEKRETHVDTNVLEALINEYKFEEFIDMDTNYFNKDNIRRKAEIVQEKQLYSLYYDYDSAFEHGLWGAIRESTMMKCDNPAHQYHCVPGTEEITLKSVFSDCVYIMNKTIMLLDNLYGLPETKVKEALAFEESINR